MSTLAFEEPGPARVDADGPLIEALRRRDAIAAEGLVTRYGARAYRLAIGITGNAADAEEVVQDAFWSVMRKIETFRGDAAFGSWLYRIVANAAVQRIRSGRHRRTEISVDEVLPVFHDPAIHSALRAALSSAIAELSPEYRIVVILRDVEGLPMADVAGTAGITLRNAKTRLHRARLLLRKRLATFMDSATVGG